MAMDVESLLAEVSAESPCGEDLTYDPAYMELERIAQGTPEQQVGDTVVEAEEPNWRDVRDQAMELLGRTKDIRVAVYLTLAQLQMEGVPGLRDGLALLRGLVEQYWDEFYPQLDPDDDYDPTERMNIVAQLSPPPEVFDDPMKFKARLRQAPLADSRQLGQYGLRHILIARGDMTPPEGADEKFPDLSVIEGAFQDTDSEHLQEIVTAANEALEHLSIIDSLLTQRVGVGNVPNLDQLTEILGQMSSSVEQYTGGAGGGGEPGAEPGGDVDAGGAPGGGGGPAISGDIRSPEDVIRVLDKICEYYQRNEPSSPVPLIVRRAKKLVRKNFIEIIQDLNPDGLRTIEMVSGPFEDPNAQQQY